MARRGRDHGRKKKKFYILVLLASLFFHSCNQPGAFGAYPEQTPPPYPQL